VIKHQSAIAVLAAAAMLLIYFALPASADQPAAVTYLNGSVDYRRSDSQPWRPLQQTRPVRANDIIRTGKNGYVELTLPDGSILRLAPDTVFQIDRSLFPENQPRRFSARLLLGKLWARVTSAVGVPGGSFHTATTTAVATTGFPKENASDTVYANISVYMLGTITTEDFFIKLFFSSFDT